MELIKDRIIKLRSELNKIKSNREKLDYLKNYYKGKKAIIIGTGPKFTDYIEIIKKNINENTILICIKQSIKYFDMIADFHLLNFDHMEEYYYNKNYVPIKLLINYSKSRLLHSNADINFYTYSLKNISHKRKFSWNLLNTDIDFLSMNDYNLGKGENMVLNCGHIMMELCLPLCVHLGVASIILNGFVGGSEHGTDIKNALNWDKKKILFKDQEILYEQSKYLPKYLKDNFDINIYSICDTNYFITKINYEEFQNIII